MLASNVYIKTFNFYVELPKLYNSYYRTPVQRGPQVQQGREITARLRKSRRRKREPVPQDRARLGIVVGHKHSVGV